MQKKCQMVTTMTDNVSIWFKKTISIWEIEIEGIETRILFEERNWYILLY